MVIRNISKMCWWNDQGHEVCDQDFGDRDVGPVMLLVPH